MEQKYQAGDKVIITGNSIKSQHFLKVGTEATIVSQKHKSKWQLEGQDNEDPNVILTQYLDPCDFRPATPAPALADRCPTLSEGWEGGHRYPCSIGENSF